MKHFPAIISLDDLNGQDGFVINAEHSDDGLGFCVRGTGDINGDGHNDLVVSTPYYDNYRGRSYVIFGREGLGSSGVFNSSNVSVNNGFVIDGENINDFSGYRLSAAGDVNGDGKEDLIIGAVSYKSRSNKGRSYVIFGGDHRFDNKSIFNLSGLTGLNGFKIDGENNGDWSGVVSGIGDFNGDGYDDLLIGAPYYPKGNNSYGRSYVIFGGLQIGHSGILNLSNLSGMGFILNGESSWAISGASISSAGDFNGDGYADLLIGSPNFGALGTTIAGGFITIARESGYGRSYVVFGGRNVGSSGVFDLSTLTGWNGFRINGEGVGDMSGVSLSEAGDFNGDGYGDIIIGAPYSNSWNGGAYVIFGGLEIFSGGEMNLSALDGSNGFKLSLNQGFWNGFSVSSAGDINGDGYSDIVIGTRDLHRGLGAYGSYVIFGGSNVGGSGKFNLSSLNGDNGFILFSEKGGAGWSVSGVGDVNGDGCDDIAIGTPGVIPSWGMSWASVVFGCYPRFPMPPPVSLPTPRPTSTSPPRVTIRHHPTIASAQSPPFTATSINCFFRVSSS